MGTGWRNGHDTAGRGAAMTGIKGEGGMRVSGFGFETDIAKQGPKRQLIARNGLISPHINFRFLVDALCYLGAMNRTALAFGIAPLWVPLLVGGGKWFLDSSPQSVPFAVIVSTFSAYGGTYLLGAPAFAFLRSRGYTARWLSIVLGFAVGTLVFLVFLFLFSLALVNSVEFALAYIQVRFTVWNLSNLIAVVAPGLLGALVGITIWMVARPDKSH